MLQNYKYSLPFVTVRILHFICSFSSMLGNDAILITYQINTHYNTYAHDCGKININQ